MGLIQRDGKPVGTQADIEAAPDTLAQMIEKSASRLPNDQKEIYAALKNAAAKAAELESHLSQAAAHAEKQAAEIKRLRSRGDDTSASIIEDLQVQIATYQEEMAQRIIGVFAYEGISMTRAKASAICRHIPRD